MTLLKTGIKAPEFRGLDQDGRSFGLKDYAGRKLVLYFYPKDDTPGCTAEACSLRDEHAALRKLGYEVVGVSADEVKKHKKFATKYALPFRLLADTERTAIEAYGVWGRKKFMGREFDGIIRTTFIINEKGVIERIITAVRTADHAQQVMVGDAPLVKTLIARGAIPGKPAPKAAPGAVKKGAAKGTGKAKGSVPRAKSKAAAVPATGKAKLRTNASKVRA
jgi:thioredoxin-dependent peroxiredoxin